MPLPAYCNPSTRRFRHRHFAGRNGCTRGLREARLVVRGKFAGWAARWAAAAEQGHRHPRGGMPCKWRFRLSTALLRHPTRGLREIDSWFGGSRLVVRGKSIRGLREITRGLREICDVKVLQNRGAGSWFPGPLLFKSLLFLFVNKNRERNVIVCGWDSETMGRIRK